MSIVSVVGSAPCWEDDLSALRETCPDVLLCGINRAILLPLDFRYYLSGHPEVFAEHVAARKESGFVFEAIGANRCQGYDTIYRPAGRLAWGGSVAYAITLLVPRGHVVVLCGCPFDFSGHFNDPAGNYHGDELWDWFLLGHPHRQGFNGNVRSMSGRTRELFGYPEKEWLSEHS